MYFSPKKDDKCQLCVIHRVVAPRVCAEYNEDIYLPSCIHTDTVQWFIGICCFVYSKVIFAAAISVWRCVHTIINTWLVVHSNFEYMYEYLLRIRIVQQQDYAEVSVSQTKAT